MIEYKSPNLIDANSQGLEKLKIFLAGSIEMGVAEDWQKKLVNQLKDLDIVLMNPRRDDWDSSWIQSIDNPKFYEQVDWELRHIENSDIAVFYFDPATKSPITLMELGYRLGMYHRLSDMIVCCPTGFWRKGNVDIICHRAGIPVFETIDDIITQIECRV